MNRIAIVNSNSFAHYFPTHLERLRKIGEVEFFHFSKNIKGKELAEKLKDFNYIIASVTPFFTSDFFENHPGCKIISRHGIGYNNVDIISATQHNCFVSIVEGVVEKDAVAENAIALLMNITRRQTPAIQSVKQDEWHTRANYLGYQVSNKVVAVIGYGNIGSRVGTILKNGFNCEVLAYDPNIANEDIELLGAIPLSFEQCIKNADIISINAYLSQDNYHLISKEVVSMMKNNVIIINTARGELVDQDAILEGLKSNKIFGYATDVVENEPIDHNHRLLTHPNVVVTPHISAYTYECLEKMGDKCVRDCERVFNGLKPENLVNSDCISQ
jgi:lactate dehydrogenase-like 2-hydroxyacid dehydrogenase